MSEVLYCDECGREHWVTKYTTCKKCRRIEILNIKRDSMIMDLNDLDIEIMRLEEEVKE